MFVYENHITALVIRVYFMKTIPTLSDKKKVNTLCRQVQYMYGEQ